jgi:hypothetical protein
LLDRKSIEGKREARITHTQLALKNTLDLFDGELKDLLLFYLSKEHGISVCWPEGPTRDKIVEALESIFGQGANILVDKFDSELKKISQAHSSLS